MPLETFNNLEPKFQVREKINAAITQVNALVDAGSAQWGNISGILADQLDLQGALDLKVNTSTLSNYETTTQLNSRDTANRSRINHTGTQSIATIDNLQTELDSKLPLQITTNTLAYSATINLDFLPLTGTYQTVSLTGDLAFTTSNASPGRNLAIRLICDSVDRVLSFPVGWKFLGAPAPVTIKANKVAVLSISFFGVTDSEAICSYSEEV